MAATSAGVSSASLSSKPTLGALVLAASALSAGFTFLSTSSQALSFTRCRTMSSSRLATASVTTGAALTAVSYSRCSPSRLFSPLAGAATSPPICQALPPTAASSRCPILLASRVVLQVLAQQAVLAPGRRCHFAAHLPGLAAHRRLLQVPD